MDRALLIRQIDAPILVVAEGSDERRIIFELLRRRQPALDVSARDFPPRAANPGVQIVNTGDRNFARLSGLTPIIPRFDRVQRLILVFDAEEDPVGTFDAIRSNLADSGFELPDRPWDERAVHGRACVIAVLPNGSTTGSLEAMLLAGVAVAPGGTEQLQCVDDFIRCVRKEGDGLTARRDKRRLYAWLSILDEPERFAGRAAARGDLPLHTPQLERLAELILGR